MDSRERVHPGALRIATQQAAYCVIFCYIVCLGQNLLRRCLLNKAALLDGIVATSYCSVLLDGEVPRLYAFFRLTWKPSDSLFNSRSSLWGCLGASMLAK